MEYKDINHKNVDYLFNEMLNDIFKDINLSSLNDYEKSFYVYDYLTKNIAFDDELWNEKKNLTKIKDSSERIKKAKNIPPHFQQIINVFLLKKGICSSLSQVYKVLLEKLGIIAVAVIGYDEDDLHQLILVKRGTNWSFDDITLGIIKPEKRLEYFDYDNYQEKKQKMIGIMSEKDSAIIYKRSIYKEEMFIEKEEEYGLYKIPNNIKKIGSINNIKEQNNKKL